VVSGAIVGGLLAVCNVYSGLKLGWTTSMAVTGAIVTHAAWGLRSEAARQRSPFLGGETLVAATAAAAAGVVSSAGLVSALPALALLTGRRASFVEVAAWVFAVGVFGAAIAAAAAGILADRSLRFPNGVALGETIEKLGAAGRRDRGARVLLLGALFSGVIKSLSQLKWLRVMAFPGAIGGYPLLALGWALDPSPLRAAIGGLIGPRACASLLLGSALAYGVGAPALLARGLVIGGDPSRSWFRELASWLLWPGVSLMVASSLAAFALGAPRLAASLRRAGPGETAILPRSWLAAALGASSLLVAALLWGIFGVGPVAGSAAVGLAVALGLVGVRAQGETGVTPVGPMARAAQLGLGIAAPGAIPANLMGATLAGGAASSGAELMGCLRAGLALGVLPSRQWGAHVAGSLGGAVIGTAAYLVLLPDPSRQLFTAEWPAPAVAQWKAVTEVLCRGAGALPAGAARWSLVAALIAVGLTFLESWLPLHLRRWVPSAASIGLGFVVPAQQSLAIASGGLLALVIARVFPVWSRSSWVVLCGGILAGESLVGAAWVAAGLVW
jgi:hypothetical protein